VNQLPPGSQQPVLTVTVGQTIAAMYIGLRERRASTQQDHRLPDPRRQPKLAGGRRRAVGRHPRGKLFAMRAWLDPDSSPRTT